MHASQRQLLHQARHRAHTLADQLKLQLSDLARSDPDQAQGQGALAAAIESAGRLARGIDRALENADNPPSE